MSSNNFLQKPSCANIEGSTGWPLRVFRPLLSRHAAFMPPVAYMEKERLNSYKPYTLGTPMPEPVSPNSTSPAWDPSSRTPGQGSSWGNAAWPEEREPTVHQWRFNQAIVGKEFLAEIKGKVKPVSVKVNKDGDFTKGKLNKVVPAKDVSVTRPHTHHTNRFLVLIGGHAGKWVRRVSHMFEGADINSPLTFTVAVVEIREGEEDLDTGNRLQFSSEVLAVTSEDGSSIERNTELRARLRAH